MIPAAASRCELPNAVAGSMNAMSEMSGDELTTAEAKPLSPLQIFFVKVAIITAATIAVLY